MLWIQTILFVAQTFDPHEATIAQTHDALRAGRTTCRALVDTYLERIARFDPLLHSLILVNPEARREAAELDARLAHDGTLAGPLHCVPIIVKDNMETAGLRTSNGALVFANYIPTKDAFQVRRIKEAGAIVLAKSNLAEWAFTPYETVSSILPGYTRNPYALDRVTAGSSGGTAAAVAANLGLAGLGSDTGNSIRGPSSHQALVGVRSTMGLTSRAGIFPLAIRADIAGPMTRTVEDAARILQVVAGADADDPITANAKPGDYLKTLRQGMQGAVIGVLRQAYKRDTTDAEVERVFEAALEDLRRAGATIVEGVNVNPVARPAAPCMGFKYDLNQFLAARPGSPVKDLAAILKKNNGFHPTAQRRLEMAEAGPANGPESAACKADDAYRATVRNEVLAAMDGRKLDALVYPTWSNPPRLIGDLNTPHGDNSQFYSPTTGFPAINVPMGYTRGSQLPAGLTLLGRPYSEAALLRIAYAYEQATRHRRPPDLTAPPLQPRRESIEWTDVWMPETNSSGLPRVLLIGDSITRAYYATVAEKLKGKAFVARYTTSKAIGDPGLLAELQTILAEARFDAVHFNIGMHGWGYSEDEYRRGLPLLVGTIRAAGVTRVLCATTTPIRKDHDNGANNQRIIERNAAARAYANANGIAINDLHALMRAQTSDLHTDDVHFNATANALMGEQVAKAIAELLERR